MNEYDYNYHDLAENTDYIDYEDCYSNTEAYLPVEYQDYYFNLAEEVEE